MKLTIISPENVIFEGNTDKVSVPGSKCPFEILKGHAPIISSLKSGVVSYTEAGEEKRLSVKGGFVEVSNDEVVACVELG